MANYGLSNPWIGKWASGDAYSDAFKCGKAVNTSIAPGYASSSLYADNKLAEQVDEFTSADVTLGVNTLPSAAVTTIFGHEKNVSGEVIYKTTDVANYVGYGFYTSEINDGVSKFVGCFLPKVKFSEGADSYETKGENITFSTPTLSGKAMADDKNNWKYVEEFDTEEAAIAWIKSKLGVSAE